MHQIVGVHARDVSASTKVEARVERVDDAAVRPCDETKAVVRVGERRRDGTARVAGAIIDDNTLEVLERLARHAPKRCSERRRAITDGQQDGNDGLSVDAHCCTEISCIQAIVAER